MPQLPCQACGQQVDVPDDKISQPRLLNLPQTAMLVIEHCGQLQCPGCGAIVAPRMVGVGGTMFALAVVPPQMQKRVIEIANKMPPEGGLIKQ